MAAAQEVKLFNKWNLEEIEVSDIALSVSETFLLFCFVEYYYFYLICNFWCRISLLLKASMLPMSHTLLVATNASASERLT